MKIYTRFLHVFKFYHLHVLMYAIKLWFLNEFNYGLYWKIELFFYRKRNDKQTMSKSIEEHPRKALFFWNRYTGNLLGRKIHFKRNFYFKSIFAKTNFMVCGKSNMFYFCHSFLNKYFSLQILEYSPNETIS